MATMRVADYLVQKLVENGIRDVFLVTGGGAMHLNDAFGRNPEMHYVCCHHEQGCAVAAESYTRLSNRLCAVNVTTGPGGTNAITGVYGAYVDSIAMFVVSGQVKWETTVRSTDVPLRQLGDQEIDIIRMVESVTKYAVCVEDPKTIRYHLEKALFLAKEGRPGPVWIDVPMNVQGAPIDPDLLAGFTPSDEGYGKPSAANHSTDLRRSCQEIAKKLANAERPVLTVGSGVRIAGARDAMLRFIEKTGIPVVTAWNAHDLVWDNHPNYAGRPGTIGDRAGNFSVQNADLLLVVGSRLNIRQVSYTWKSFARKAYKIWVDIDPTELQKPTIKPDMPIVADARLFFETLEQAVSSGAVKSKWLDWCRERVKKYPTVLPEYWERAQLVNPYCFVESLFKALPDGETVVCGNGTACVVAFQAANIKPNQRLYTNSGCASMGYDVPAALGACVAQNRKQVVCLAGDGSIMMNLQELQTIVGLKLPVKIFLLNNQGYHSIRQTQNAFFPDGKMGFDEATGVSFPDFEKLAQGFGIPYARCASHKELQASIQKTLSENGPFLCEVMLDPEQQFSPKLSSRRLPDGRMISSPLEDLSPFLPREELQQNLFFPMETE